MLSLVSHVAKKNAAVMGYTDDKKVISERVKLKEANTHSIFSFFFFSLEYVNDSKLLLWNECQAIAVINSNTYSDPHYSMVSVKRSLRCVNNIYLLPT